MGERIEKVEKMIKNFENTSKRIVRKYNDKDIKNEIDDIDKILGDIDGNLKRKNLHIERLEEELKQVSSSEKSLIEEYKNAIEKAKSEYEEEKQSSGMQKYLDKKEELSIKLKSDKTNNEKLIKQEIRNAEDKLRANLTQENMQLDKDINRTQINMQLVLADMKDFKYEYDEVDGIKVPKNGEEFKKINEKYEELKSSLNELQNAKQLCESKLKEFKDRDNREAEKISKTWREAKEIEDQKESVKKDSAEETKNPEEKEETENNAETIAEPKNEEEEKEEAENNAEIATEQRNEEKTEKNELEEKFPVYSEVINSKEKDVMESDISNIIINENQDIISATFKNGYTKIYDLTEILRDKKKIFKDNTINEYCRYLCNDSRMKGFLLARRVNPAIIKIFENDENMQEIYIQCLKDKKELPFEFTHDLRNSKLGFLDRMKMRICAKAEDKIPGTKITFAERFWNKNKSLPEGEEQNIADEVLEGEYKKVEQDKERNMKEEIKVDNKYNRIEEEAKKVMEETEAQRAEDVKNILNENESQEK